MKIEINSSRDALRIGDVHEILSKEFWAPDITIAELSMGIGNSALVVGAYAEEGRQIGFLRVISDKVRFAYLLDVVVHEDYRRQGIGRRMVKYALSHTELKHVYQWLLVTKDAQGVYEQCGFVPLNYPNLWMSIIKPRPDRTRFGE